MIAVVIVAVVFVVIAFVIVYIVILVVSFWCHNCHDHISKLDAVVISKGV